MDDRTLHHVVCQFVLDEKGSFRESFLQLNSDSRGQEELLLRCKESQLFAINFIDKIVDAIFEHHVRLDQDSFDHQIRARQEPLPKRNRKFLATLVFIVVKWVL